ncbi:MAG TPA: hypothetical protein VKU19_36725 [Bryobacteraceae bacterium]|nr:hypothetical protein [Bryobacteraceae bacterium]
MSGTCGFYQGLPTNIVYSQAFTGDTGSFCTGFMSGGSFNPDITLDVGDIFAQASHDTSAFAPSGFGVFANFNTDFQVTQQYILTGISTPTTPTGTVMTFFDHVGGTDDGSGGGSCQVSTNLSVGGISSTTQGGAAFSFPVTFGQPFTATENAQISCNQLGVPAWGDSGMNSTSLGPLLVFDANGQFLGNAVPVSVPEPATPMLLFIAIVLRSCYTKVKAG